MTARRSRSRTSSQSYTSRLQRRTVAPSQRLKPGDRRHGGRAQGQGRSETSSPPAWPLVLLLVAAEVGHLCAVTIEWPTSTHRGVLHAVTAAVLGFAAASYYVGPHRIEIGLTLSLVLAAPIGWLVGAVAGLSPYARYPFAAAAALTATEITAAVVIACRHDILRPGWRVGSRAR